MADPISIISIVGTVVGVVGQVVSGMNASKADAYNAQIATQNAMIARNNAEFNAEQQQRAARLRIGAAEANYGASGITTEGSPLDVLESSARNSEIDRQAIIYQGNIRAAGYQDQATLDQMRSGSDLTTGVFRGIDQFAEGASAYLTRGPGTPIPTNYTSAALGVAPAPWTYM